MTLTAIRKLERQPGLDFGAATAFPILSADLKAGMRIGISEFVAGSVDLYLPYDEAIYMLEGEIEIDGDGETHALKPREFLWMPKGRKIVYRAKAPCRFLYAIPDPGA